MRRFALLLVLVCLTSRLAAAQRLLVLDPSDASIEMRAFGLGLLPLDGRFTSFHGTLAYDPNARAACRVELSVNVRSLSMLNPLTRDTVVGPEFLDAARFPSLVFVGACEEAGLGGMLGLHGVSAPFRLDLTWRPDQVVAEGSLRRADWGMTAMPLVGGRTVRIRVSVSLR